MNGNKGGKSGIIVIGPVCLAIVACLPFLFFNDDKLGQSNQVEGAKNQDSQEGSKGVSKVTPREFQSRSSGKKKPRIHAEAFKPEEIKSVGQDFSLKLSDGRILKGKIDSYVANTSGSSFGVRLDGIPGRLVYFQSSERSRALVFFDNSEDALELKLEQNQWLVSAVKFSDLMCASRRATYPLQPGMGLPKRSSPATEESGTPQKSSAPAAFQSKPGARAVVYCDFDGESVNQPFWEPFRINAQPSGLSDAQVAEVMRIVAEDFAPFDVNVTNVRAVFDATSANRRVMCISTPTDTAGPGAGGIAGTFTFVDDLVCWNFNLDSAQSAGDTISHEVGHTLGLDHDGEFNDEYYDGHGSDSVEWGPIMGAASFATLVQWSNGSYTGANEREDDLAVMTRNGISYRDDDFGNSLASGEPVLFTGRTREDIQGLIERNTDIDVFVVTVEDFGRILLNGGSVEAPANNLDLRLQVIDANSTTLLDFTSDDLQTALSELTLQPGVYEIRVSGDSSGTPLAASPTGWSSYGSLGNYQLSFIPDQGLGLNQALEYYGLIASPIPATSWVGQIETSQDNVDAAVSAPITDDQVSEFSITAATDQIQFWYRVSSEEDFDYLEFFIDGNRVQRWSGDVRWSQYSRSGLSNSSHTFTWRYTKDGSVSEGADSAWVDQVVIPGAGGGFSDFANLNDLAPNGLQDKDSDGVADLLEYTLGTAPATPETSQPINFDPDTQQIIFAVDGGNKDLVVRVEASTDLINWQTIAVSYASEDFKVVEDVSSTSSDLSDAMKQVILDLSGLNENFRFARVRTKKY